jgi:hypothetical protein
MFIVNPAIQDSGTKIPKLDTDVKLKFKTRKMN